MFFFPTCQRRSPILNAVLFAWLALALLMLCVRLSHGSENDTQRAALVHVGPSEGGSGVCISSDGIIVTAAHCVIVRNPDGQWGPKGGFTVPPTSIIRFPNREKQTARVVAVWYRDKQSDIAILKVEGRGYPTLPLAKASPVIGEAVTSIGYPAGHFARFESAVVWIGETQDKSLNCITTSHRGNPGHSGGPLLNLRGEVIGICSQGTVDVAGRNGIVQTEQLSMWARVETIHAALKSAGFSPSQPVSNSPILRPVLHLWGSVDCAPCINLDRDYDAGLLTFGGKPLKDCFTVEKHSKTHEPELARQLQVVSTPTVLRPDNGDSVVSYTTPQDLDARMVMYFQPLSGDSPGGSLSLDVQLPADVPEVRDTRTLPNKQTPAEPKEVEKSDGAGLRVIALVRKQNLGVLIGSRLSAGEKWISTGFKSKLQGIIGDKADLDVVFERLNPERFKEVSTAVAMDGDAKYLIVVLAEKRFDGVIGIVVEQIEKFLLTLKDKALHRVGIEPIFERTEQEYFDEVNEALETSEPDAEASVIDSATKPGESWLSWLMATIAGLVGGARDTLLGRKAKAGAG